MKGGRRGGFGVRVLPVFVMLLARHKAPTERECGETADEHGGQDQHQLRNGQEGPEEKAEFRRFGVLKDDRD
jgi:hypothetical protein